MLTSERRTKVDWMDWLNAISDIWELRDMNTQENRHRMILRLLLIPAVVIVSLIGFVIWFLNQK